MKVNFDVVKVADIGGLVLGVAGTLLKGWASKKTIEKTIKELVEKSLQK